MAGYAKIWTSIWNDKWYKSLSCLQRGLWLQLIAYAKFAGDTGAINPRNFAELSLIFGLDDSTCAKNLRKFAEVGKITLETDEYGITIKIPNYEEYQRLMKPEEVRGRAKSPRKIPEKSPLTEQNQTEPDRTEQNTVVSPKCDPTPPVKIPNPYHKEFVTFFTEEYQNRFNVKYDFVGGRDGNLIKGLLKTFGLELLQRITLEFFNSDDQFIKEKTGFTVPALKMRANQIAANLSRNKTFMDKLSPAGRETLKNAAAWMARTEGVNAGK